MRATIVGATETIIREGIMAPRTPKDPAPKPAKAKSPAKPAAAKSPAARPKEVRASAGAPQLTVVEKTAAASGKRPGLKLKDLVDQVATATGTKKPDAKKAVEAVLSALSSALKSGADVAVPPLGKLRVAKSAGSVLTLKLRQPDGGKAAGKPAGKPLADDGDDD